MAKDDDDGHRLRLTFKGRRSDDGRIVSQTMRRVRNTLSRHGARQGGKRQTARMRGSSMSGGYKPTMQRCAVRMSFSANKVAGQWAAHGRYIAREGAQSEQEREQGFTAQGHADVAKELDRWQASGDPRMFKFILSPEFGQDMDSMEKFTKDFMAKLEKDMGVPIEWVAVDHYNTDHPHVHVAMRGVDRDGQELLIRPDYVKTTLRHRAQEAATEQLGIRTEQQQETAFEREVKQRRFTSLDRMLKKKAEPSPGGGAEVRYDDGLPKSAMAKKMRLFQIRRLVALEKMGLAQPVGHMRWSLSSQLEPTLRKIQESGDILKTMYSARDIQSDPRMPVQKTMPQVGQSIEGRLIATGEDESTGKPYVLLESPDGIVHHIYQTMAMQKARAEGTLKRGDYLTVEGKELDRGGKKLLALVMRNHGSSHKLLTDSKHLAAQVLRNVHKHKALPQHRPLAGWLGEYQQAIQKRAAELLRAGVIRPGANGMEVAQRRSRQPGLQPQGKTRGPTR